MGWQTVAYVYVDPDTGLKRKGYRKVWVEDPKPAPTVTKTAPATTPYKSKGPTSAQQKAALARKRAAALAAAAADKARRQRLMWEALGQQTRSMLGLLSPSTPPPRDGWGLAPEDLAAKKASEAERLREADAARWKAYAEYWQNRLKKEADQKTVDEAVAGDPTSALALEKLIVEARDLQASSQGVTLDMALIQKIDAAYQKHVEFVASKFGSQVDLLKTYYVLDSQGNLVKPKTNTDRQKAYDLFYSSDFQALQNEYTRLFGAGTTQGSFVNTMTTRGAIADEQRRFLYDAAKETLFKQVDKYRKLGEVEAAQAALDQWDNEKWLYEAAIYEIDPTKTSFRWVLDPETERLVQKRRTVEEEFQYRRGQYMAEMQRQYAEWKNQQQLEQIRARQLAHELNDPDLKRQELDNKTLAASAQALGYSDPGMIQSNQDIQKIVQKSMETWNAQHYDQMLPQKVRDALKRNDRGANVARSSKEYQYFLKAKAEAEKRFYAAFGAEKPSFFDSVLEFGPVKGTLEGLGLLWSTIGSGSKVLATAASGAPSEFIATGGNFDYNKFPPELRMQIHDATAALVKDEDFIRKFQRNFRIVPGTRAYKEQLWKSALQQVTNEFGSEFVKTPAGQQWSTETGQVPGGFGITQGRNSAEQARITQELQDFYKNVYQADNPLQVAQGISKYGMSPFTPDSALANLLAGLAFDPLNLVPLNALTWSKRLKYATEITRDVNGFKKLTLGAYKWATVSEEKLKFQKFLATFKTELEAGGKSVDEVMSIVLDRLSGITKKADREAAIAQLRKLGVIPRDANTHQLLTLAEDALLKELDRAGATIKSVADQAKSQFDLEKIAAAEAKQAASKSLKIADAATLKVESRAREVAEAGAKRVAERRVEAAARLSARASRPSVVRVAEAATEELAQTATAHLSKKIIPEAGTRRAVFSTTEYRVLTTESDTLTLADFKFPANSEFAKSSLGRAYVDELGALVESGPRKGRPDLARRQHAAAVLYEASRRDQALQLAAAEGVGTPLARKSKQYIASASDLASRLGARSEGEAAQLLAERTAFEGAKRRFASLRSALKSGRITATDFVEKTYEDVQSLGLRTDHSWSAAEERFGDIRDVSASPSTVRMGELLVQDALTRGDMSVALLDDYYETFSLLPDHMRGIGLQTELMSNILNPLWRKESLTRAKFAAMLRSRLFDIPASPLGFRNSAGHLFAMFHGVMLDGDLEKLLSLSKSVDVMLKSDPDNIFGWMWRVMEARSGVAWAKGFFEVEDGFLSAAVKTEVLHPNMALAMVPYGPYARRLPTRHGFSPNLQSIPETTSPLFRAAPANWTDTNAQTAIAQILEGVGGMEAGMRLASQTIHYAAVRYGDTFRRAFFGARTLDGNILSSFRGLSPSNEFGFLSLKSDYVNTVRAEFLARGITKDADGLAKAFDNFFQRDAAAAKVAGRQAEFDPILRDLYDEAYWKGDITHNNAGLHTLNLYLMLQQPGIRGAMWTRYAKAYKKHMADAGFAKEADEVLTALFPWQYKRSRDNAFETVYGMTGDVEGRMFAADTIFYDAGLLPTFDTAAAAARARRVKDFATRELEDAAKREEFLLEDAAKRTTKVAYSASDADYHLIRLQEIATSRTKLIAQRDAALAKFGPPTQTALAIGLKKFNADVKRLVNRTDALRLVDRLPAELRPFVKFEIHMRNSTSAAAEAISGLVRMTLHQDGFAAGFEKQLAEAADIIREMPDGERILQNLGDDVGLDLWGSRLGQYFKNEPWYKALTSKSVTPEAAGVADDLGAAPQAPSPAALQTPRVTMAQRALEQLTGLTETQWIARETQQARAALKAATARGDKEARQIAFRRLQDTERARRVLTVVESGGSYIDARSVRAHVNRVVSSGWERARLMLNPKMISPYVTGAPGALVEQGRAEYRLWATARVDPAIGRVSMVGDVSAAYGKHGAALEAMIDRKIPPKFLVAAGIPPYLADDITALDLLTGLDEFADALKNPKFLDLVEDLTNRLEARVRQITGDPNYSLTQFLSDRLMQRAQFYDNATWEAHERIVRERIVGAREGARRTSITDLRGRKGTRGENPLTELMDSDMRAIVAKSKALKELGSDVHRYNEARKVLRGAYVRKNQSIQLVRQATEQALADLTRLGLKVESPGWDKAWRESFDKHFLAARAAKTDVESRKLLGQLAAEMPGATPSQVIEAFEERYALDDAVKGFEPPPISPFQKATLESAIKRHLGIDDVTDKTQVVPGLAAHGQRPPWGHRAQMREWLEKYGVWTPRTTAAIEGGHKKSWSIYEEAAYYRSNWGDSPVWAHPELMEDGARLELMRHDEGLYLSQMREWGVFNRKLEQQFLPTDLSREAHARMLVEGNASLGIKPKRDLALERRFVLERFGKLAGDPQTGTLTSFPWLMNRDELRVYVTSQSTKSVIDFIADGNILRTVEEISVVESLIAKHMGQYFDKTLMAGKTVEYSDIFSMSANIVSDLLKDPVWLKRPRDRWGNLIRMQASFRRGLIFSNLAFAAVNVVDSVIKEAWQTWTMRAFLGNAAPSERALSVTLLELGLDRTSQLLRDTPVHGKAKIREAKRSLAVSGGMKDDGKAILSALVGVTELPASVAGLAEQTAKMRMVRRMWDGVYGDALKELKDPALADAATRLYFKENIGRLWPTVGDGPYERLFNQLMPFFSYQIKNGVIFIGEMVSHPAFYNHFERIGAFIEQQNRERWAEGHPNEVLPDHLARLVELPWAPGAFIDLAALSDASRGLRPLYAMRRGTLTVGELAGLWLRVVGAADINIVGGILNALHIPNRKGWEPIYDAEGFPTGEYREVDVPWMAPWGEPADLKNTLWPIELLLDWKNKSGRGLTAAEATQLFGQLLTFGSVKLYDRGQGLSMYYWMLKSKDPDAAKAFLQTDDGKAMQQWWLERRAEKDPTAFYVPSEIAELLDPPVPDPREWFHSQPKEWQDQIKRDLDELDALGEKWDRIIWGLTPGTDEYRLAKLQAATERYNFYRTHPEMYDFEAGRKTAADWAATLAKWELDASVQTFFNLRAQAPQKEDFKTIAEWQAAVGLWKQQMAVFLKAHPQVAEVLGSSRTSMEAVWKTTEQGWFDTLDEIGVRGIAIEAAKQAQDFDLLDQLYLINELDYSTLAQDTAVFYFDPTRDFQTMPEGIEGPPGLLGNLLPRVKVLPDFNKWRFDRMTLEQKSEFERNERYSQGLKDIIAKSKASGNFGATFVQELKKDPFLLNEYFRRNPGKREQWAANDQYIQLISQYGLLSKQGKFSEAARYFDRLPDWVKARYYEKHPEKKQRLQENMEYMSWMEKWTAFYRKRDYTGGAAFFEKMPDWVKQRYYSKHPDNQITGTSPYAKAMGKWVELLQSGDKAGAKTYFDALPQEYKDRYYSTHPEQKIRDDIHRVGQLAQYFSADDANRAQYLVDNPEFAQWLQENMKDEQSRRIMILAAYAALPKEDAWLKRVFRERYPEIFSQEAKGEDRLRRTYSFLTQYPEYLPAFDKWVKAVWASYAENVKHMKAPPKPLTVERRRRIYQPHRGRSAEWVRLHTVSA